uniref:Uncharacterized protein n=1 Tax=Ditylenchus dipsaci TaxID=166011 RepID=A0A915DX63_9BILA
MTLVVFLYSQTSPFRTHALARYLDPRFKNRFCRNQLEFSTKVAMWIQEEAASIDEPTSNVIDSEDVRSPTHKRHKDSTSFSLHADTYEDSSAAMEILWNFGR